MLLRTSRLSFALAAGLGLAAATGAFAAAPGAAPTIVTPATVAWTAGTGMDKGAQVAVLDGNPDKGGPYTIRIKIPAGAKFGPHFHGDVERVTVISGTMLVGLGDTMKVATMKALPAGSFVVVPGGLHHYAMAKTATVIQISGNGPSTTTMLAPHKM